MGEPKRKRARSDEAAEAALLQLATTALPAPWNMVKVFSATRAKEREQLGEKITGWLQQNPGVEVVDKVVTQSSDNEFHCLTITLFGRQVQR
jgi:hypothetical protein